MQQQATRTEVCGIKRATKFSPNHIDNDTAIFLAVSRELEKLGCSVKTYSEDQFLADNVCANSIFGMMRETALLERLTTLEQSGSTILNSAQGINNCTRKKLTEILIANAIPHPKSHIHETSSPFCLLNFPYWIKRGDAHAILKKDVCHVTTQAEAAAVLTDFKERGIAEAVVSEHLPGDLVKFYGVEGTDFFHWFYPSASSHSKFGLEAINGETKGYRFNPTLLQQISSQAAQVMGVPIYGGDAIVSPDGEIKLIDFNDWPSFACCREEAAYYIAQRIHKQITE